jgi:formate dehydrogenase subunit delta
MSEAEASRLTHMARQIAAAFRHLPPDEAAGAVAAHINLFWPVVMRREFVARFGANPAGLDPLLARAVRLIRVPAE